MTCILVINRRAQKSPASGACVILGLHSGGGGRVQRWPGSSGSAFLQYFLGMTCAGSASGGDAQALAELIEVVHAPGRCAADLLVGD